jgi:hypothetical protein
LLTQGSQQVSLEAAAFWRHLWRSQLAAAAGGQAANWRPKVAAKRRRRLCRHMAPKGRLAAPSPHGGEFSRQSEALAENSCRLSATYAANRAKVLADFVLY